MPCISLKISGEGRGNLLTDVVPFLKKLPIHKKL